MNKSVDEELERQELSAYIMSRIVEDLLEKNKNSDAYETTLLIQGAVFFEQAGETTIENVTDQVNELREHLRLCLGVLMVANKCNATVTFNDGRPLAISVAHNNDG
jgi:hypothetical protein